NLFVPCRFGYMAESTDTARNLFDEIDTNHDGTIDPAEFRRWLGHAEIRPVSSYDVATSGHYLNDNIISRQYYNTHATNRYDLLGSAGVVTNWTSDTAIHTSTAEETEAYLERAVDIYRDPNPQIIRRAAIEGPVTYEQRIHVRYLEPPEVPPPGPLIIKEVRRPQSPPPPALVIRQHAAAPPTPPPLILREQPPTPPPHVHSETITRYLPDLPVPKRSVVIERLPPAPEKPRDIIIERWIPYGQPPPRRTIVEPAPPAREYPEPRNMIIIYENIEARVVRQFQNLGVVRENPSDYIARYGGTLLDSATLVQQARNAGVYEDISAPGHSSTTYTTIRRTIIDVDRPTDRPS
ncbi:unnamed protein product, partial [Rotaria sp. Silwood1]